VNELDTGVDEGAGYKRWRQELEKGVDVGARCERWRQELHTGGKNRNWIYGPVEEMDTSVETWSWI
jgi:hypothetical protein